MSKSTPQISQKQADIVKSANIALALLAMRPTCYVFPIEKLAKFPPLLPDNLDTGNSNDPEQIRAWAAQWPGCNWGLAAKKSRCIPVDIDTAPGKLGADTRDDIELINGNLPHTFTVQTPSGGLHLYYDEANGVRYKFALGKNGFGPDIDVPNYVVLAGCRIPGGVYSIINKSAIAPSPSWFINYLKPSNDPPNGPNLDQVPVVELDQEHNIRRAYHYLTHDARSSILGQNGEKALFDTAAILKDLAISEDTAAEMIDRYYNVPKAKNGERPHPYCDPLWSVGDCDVADNLVVKVHNAYQYATENPPGCQGFSAADDFGDDIEEFIDTPPEPVDRMADLSQRRKNSRARARRKRANQWGMS